MKTSAVFLGLCLTLTPGCSSTSVDSSVEGIWGGDHISLELSESSSTVELNCAHGTLSEAIRPDKQGHFSVSGILVLEHGGPIREDEPEDAHPAVYTGHVSGDRMTLTINISDLASPELAFTLVRGQQGRLFKCL